MNNTKDTAFSEKLGEILACFQDYAEYSVGGYINNNRKRLTLEEAHQAIIELVKESLPKKRKIPQLTKKTTIREQRDYGFNQALKDARAILNEGSSNG